MIAQAGKDHRGAHGCLPTARQQRLIQACAAAPDLARLAWQQWRAESDLERVDSASRRLLLWVYHRREELGLSAEDAAALEPHYRQVWLRNQVLLNRAAQVVGGLQAAGIQCLLLKGLALLVEVYQDEGGRYLEDFDLLVHPEDVERAVHLLNALGWKSPLPDEVSTQKSHAHGFSNAEGFSCDLHWHLLRRRYAPVEETLLWRAKRPIQLRDEPAFTLCVEHLLLHLCVHGMSWETVPPIRWILDVHLLLRHHVVNWETVLTEAQRRGVTLPLAEALVIYETVLPGEIPTFVQERLQALSPTDAQWLAYAQIVTRPSVSTVVSGLLADWRIAQFERRAKPGGLGMLRFLCLRWRVPSVWRLPGQFSRRLRRRWRSLSLIKRAG
jgi:hypothetical protein